MAELALVAARGAPRGSGSWRCVPGTPRAGTGTQSCGWGHPSGAVPGAQRRLTLINWCFFIEGAAVVAQRLMGVHENIPDEEEYWGLADLLIYFFFKTIPVGRLVTQEALQLCYTH